MRRITGQSINSVHVIAVPSETVCGIEFRYSSICRVTTWEGAEYDLLLNETGEPVVDLGLMQRVAAYYGKKFEAR